MAVAIAVIWFLKDHRILRRFTYISLAVSAVLLILPLVPGISAGEVLGASVWIKIGSMTFQPGEIAKITLAIFFAGYLSSNRDLILLAGRKIGPLQFPRFKDMGPMITAWLVSIGVLVFQRDLGYLHPVLRPVPGHDLRRHQPHQLGDHRRRADRRRRLRGVQGLLARRPADRRLDQRLHRRGLRPAVRRQPPDRRRPVRHGQRRACRAPASARAGPTWCPSPTAT